MFTVNSNNVIKMNKGDDVQFPIFVNNGDRSHLLRYEFDIVNDINTPCEEVYFYIIPLHLDYEQFVLKKTYSCNGTITTQFRTGEPLITVDNQILNKNNDVVISLVSDDTLSLCADEYNYMIRAKLKSSKINSKNIITTGDKEFMTIQISNKYPFYLLDDDTLRAD